VSTERASRENLTIFNLKSRRSRCSSSLHFRLTSLWSSRFFTERTKRAFLRVDSWWACLNERKYISASAEGASGENLVISNRKSRNNTLFSAPSTWDRTQWFSLVNYSKRALSRASWFWTHCRPRKEHRSRAPKALAEKNWNFRPRDSKNTLFQLQAWRKTWFESPPKAAKIFENTPSGALKTREKRFILLFS